MSAAGQNGSGNATSGHAHSQVAQIGGEGQLLAGEQRIETHTKRHVDKAQQGPPHESTIAAATHHDPYAKIEASLTS